MTEKFLDNGQQQVFSDMIDMAEGMAKITKRSGAVHHKLFQSCVGQTVHHVRVVVRNPHAGSWNNIYEPPSTQPFSPAKIYYANALK